MRLAGIITAVSIILAGGCTPKAIHSDEVQLFRWKQQYRHVLVAGEYIDLHERTDRSQLRQFMGIDPLYTEWCAAFLNAVLAESGMPGSETVSDYPLTAKSFLEWGSPVEYGQVGDVVVFNRCCEAWKGHVGIIVGVEVTKDNNIIYDVLGGNQDNTVSIKKFNKRRAVAIRRYEDK